MTHERRIYRHHTTNHSSYYESFIIQRNIHVQNVNNIGKILNLDNSNEFIDKR